VLILGAPNREPNICSTKISETAASFSAFPLNKNGNAKMNRYDEELLDKQMGKLTPPQDDGAIAVWLIATFLAGATLGAVLSAH
jgi:hypothetical protein